MSKFHVPFLYLAVICIHIITLTQAADLQSSARESLLDFFGADGDPCNYLGSKFNPGQGKKLCENVFNGWKLLPEHIKARCPNARMPECHKRKCTVDIDRKLLKCFFGPVQSVPISYCVKKKDLELLPERG